MRRNWAIVTLLCTAIVAVFLLAFYIHRTNRERVLAEFSQNQLHIARQTAVQIESYLRTRSLDLRRITGSDAFLSGAPGEMKAEILWHFEHLRTDNIVDISLYDRKGVLVHSTTEGGLGEDRSASGLFLWAADPANREGVRIGYEQPAGRFGARGAPPTSTPRLWISMGMPLYRGGDTGQAKGGEAAFSGMLQFRIDLFGVLAERTLLFTPAMPLQNVWIMEREGRVLLHSEHPEVALRTLRDRDESCSGCHRSFDRIEAILRTGEGTVEYELEGYPRKVAAYAPLAFANASWIVAVHAQMDGVTAFAAKSLRQTLILLVLVVAILGGLLLLLYRSHRARIEQESLVNSILGVSLLELELGEQLERILREILHFRRLKGGSWAALFLLAGAERSPVLAARGGADRSLSAAELERLVFGSACGQAALAGEAGFVALETGRTEAGRSKAAARQLGCVPIRGQRALVGILALGLADGWRRGGAEERLLTALADVVAGVVERSQAMAMIRQSEKKYHAIVDHAVEGIFQSTRDGRLLMVNGAFAAMLGFASAEACLAAVGDIAQQLYGQPEERLRLLNAVDEQGVAKGFETEFRRTDGSRIWVSINMQAILDDRGQPLYYQGFCEEIGERRRIAEERRQAAERLHKALGATVWAIAAVVETKDPYTAGHQRRVADLARTIATRMGIDRNRIEGLRIAAMIHDIGKISIPSEILSKPVKLSEIEYSLIQTHVQSGYDILKGIEFPWPIARIVYEHHERVDGSGYPGGLTGPGILTEAKILAVADVVEAISSHRPYRSGLGIGAALAEIEKNRGILYDPPVVDSCLALFNEEGYRFAE